MPVVIPPALTAIMAALLALLILWGVVVIVRAIAKIIPDSGFPGAGALHSLLVNLAQAAMAAVQWVMADFIRPVIDFVLAPVYRFLDFMRGLATFASTMADSWDWLLNELYRDFGKAKDWATHEAKVAEGWALDKIHALHDLLHAGILAARALAAHLVHAAVVELHLAIHAVKAQLYDSLHAVEHDLTKLIDHAEHLAAAATIAVAHDLVDVKQQLYGSLHAAEQDLSKLIDSTAAVTLHAAERFTTTSIHDIVGVITVDIPGVVAPVWRGLLGDVDVLEGVLGTDFPDLSGLLGDLAGVHGLDTALSLAGTATMARVLSRYLTQCGIPNCRNLSGVGRALQELFGLVGDAAFLAVLAELIADPQGAAQEVESVVGAIVSPIVSGARDLLGV